MSRQDSGNPFVTAAAAVNELGSPSGAAAPPTNGSLGLDMADSGVQSSQLKGTITIAISIVCSDPHARLNWTQSMCEIFCSLLASH